MRFNKKTVFIHDGRRKEEFILFSTVSMETIWEETLDFELNELMFK